MAFSVGIGIVTYNRKAIVSDTIDRVRSLTRVPNAALVVADDGSSDGTLAMLRDKQVPVVTGVNMGDPWNKNRALFLLSQMLGCETVILLEDDTQPNREGWEAEWIGAAERWGHANYAGAWMQEHFLSGSGTISDPICSHLISAQCAAFSWKALTYGGYFDPRFKGYGHAHVEHSHRLLRVGFGGIPENQSGVPKDTYYLLKSDLNVVECESYSNQQQIDHNLEVAKQIMTLQGYRAPWGDDAQLRQFRSETESAISDGPERFRLTPSDASGRSARGLFPRLFRRA